MYELLVRVPLDAGDDPQARELTKRLMARIGPEIEDFLLSQSVSTAPVKQMEIKVRRIFQNQPPQKVQL